MALSTLRGESTTNRVEDNGGVGRHQRFEQRVRNSGELESHTYVAPIPRSSSTCSGRRTTLTSGTSSAVQCRTSICPRLEAAAVCTRAALAVEPHRADHAEDGHRIDEEARGLRRSDVVGQHQAVGGLRGAELRVHGAAGDGHRASEQAPAPPPTCPRQRRRPRPRSRWAATCRSGRRCRPASPGTSSRTVPSSERRAVCGSAGPSSRPRSDGWIGAASTRRTISSVAGSGTSTSTTASSSTPSGRTVERSCRPIIDSPGVPVDDVGEVVPRPRLEVGAHGVRDREQAGPVRTRRTGCPPPRPPPARTRDASMSMLSRGHGRGQPDRSSTSRAATSPSNRPGCASFGRPRWHGMSITGTSWKCWARYWAESQTRSVPGSIARARSGG